LGSRSGDRDGDGFHVSHSSITKMLSCEGFGLRAYLGLFPGQFPVEKYFRFYSPFYIVFEYPFWQQWRLHDDIQKELIAEYDAEVARTGRSLRRFPQAPISPGNLTQIHGAGRLPVTCRKRPEMGDSYIENQQAGVPGGSQIRAVYPASTAAMLAQFDQQTAEAKAALASFKLSGWDENWSSWREGRPGSTTRSTRCGATG